MDEWLNLSQSFFLKIELISSDFSNLFTILYSHCLTLQSIC